VAGDDLAQGVKLFVEPIKAVADAGNPDRWALVRHGGGTIIVCHWFLPVDLVIIRIPIVLGKTNILPSHLTWRNVP
jgi:hypothetical protein